MLKANLQFSLRSLWSNKRRSALALLGITIGIAAFITLISIGMSIKQASMRQFIELGTDFLVIQKDWSARFNDNPNERIPVESAERLPQALPQIAQATPVGSAYGSFNFEGDSITSANTLLACDPNFLEINRFSIEQGRFFLPVDTDSLFCVLGHSVAQELQDQSPLPIIGQEIQIDNKTFQILGTLNWAPSGSLQPFYMNSSILIPIPTYKKYFAQPDITYLLARTRGNIEDSQALEAALQNYLKLFSPSIKTQITTAEILITQLNKQMDLYTLLLGSIGGISLLVGGIGIMNIMLVAVSERKKEIGIRRAVGARRRDILNQFLTESTVLCLLGGLLGIFLGTGSTLLLCQLQDITFSFSAWPLFLGSMVALIIGLFFGIYPARQAATMPPVIALRSE